MFIKEFEKVEVSYYNTVTTSTGGTTSLAEFLAKDFSRQVLAMRFAPSEAKGRSAKLALPAVTISGVFHPRRAQECLIGLSGLICIDIDAKDNPSRNFIERLPPELTEWNAISYLSRSASGKGLFALVKVRWPVCHKSHFLALEKEFGKRGFVVDKACSDITRLRCATYDPQPYYNPNAVVYDGLADNDQPMLNKAPAFRPAFRRESDSSVLNVLIDRAVAQRGFSLDDYNEWIRAGYALASLGEDGRELFHRLSASSPKYSRSECDRMFTSFLRTSRGQISLGTLFRMLTQTNN